MGVEGLDVFFGLAWFHGQLNGLIRQGKQDASIAFILYLSALISLP